MRVHYLSTSTIPSRAANAVHVMRICAAMVRLGHHPTLFCRTGDDHDDDRDDDRDDDHDDDHDDVFERYGVDDRFPLERLDSGRLPVASSVAYAWRTRRASQRRGLPDVYWGRQLQSLVAVSSLGRPLVYEVHALAPSPYHRWLERRLLGSPSMSHVVAISKALREDFLAAHPTWPVARTLVAHDGADVPDSEPTAVSPWPGRQGHLQVGFTGHLYPGRGADVIVELGARIPEADFHLVGGTDADIERWRTIATSDGIENLHFHGHRPAALVPSYLARFDVVLAPYQQRVSTSQGSEISRWISPMKIFEYMAARRAIVASDLPTIGEVLTDGEHALLCPPDDIDAWEAAVRRLADDRTCRERLADAARHELRERYTWTQRATDILAATRGVGDG